MNATFASDEVVRMRIALRRIAEIADAPTKDWSRVVGSIARAALENYALTSNNAASCDTRRMAETGNTDSVRSTGGAVPEGQTPKLRPRSIHEQ